ncbi:MAG: 4Fe-4S binding protein [Desulfobacterales bacterium]|nr:4Fe-4S binding protein [Desulfobacterales bacterium]
MSDELYKKLAKHLNTLPGGFPPTETGIEIRILKRLFTPEEAELASNLTMMVEPTASIAKRIGRNEAELTGILEQMAQKGLIVRSTKGGQNQYMAAQFVVGIWEYQVNRLTEGLIKDFNEYLPYLMKTQFESKTKQLRVIPISKSVNADIKIMPYEEAEKIIESQSKIVVADCICRKEHKMVGKGCDSPLRSCLSFGSGAYYYEANGLGNEITKEEALNILKKGIEAGLVLQPGNSKKPLNICMCCGCCCQVLVNLKKMENAAELSCSNWYAVVDENECVACGICEQRCPMDAITIEDTAQVNLTRCIGCGVCAGSCEANAIRLKEKDQSKITVPPENIAETYFNIAKERGMI